MQALVIPPAKHQAAGELVHNDDLPLPDDVIHVPPHAAVGLDGLVDMVQQGGIFRVGQVFHMEIRFRLSHAPRGDGGGFPLFVDDIIRLDIVLAFLGVHFHHLQGGQRAHKDVRLPVEVGALVPLAGDNQRRPGLVDEDGVHLVHNGENMAPLDHLPLVNGHIIPQIIEAQFVVGAVCDIAGIGGAPLVIVHLVQNCAAAQPKPAVDFAHPVAVALDQIIVDRHDMDAPARQSVEIGGHSGHQGFALAGLHLGNAALMQHNAANDLHSVGLHAQHPPSRLSADGERLRQQLVQGFPLLVTGLQLRGLVLQLLVAQGGVFRLQRLHSLDHRLYFFNFFGAGIAEQALEKRICH